jgi:acyl carrier protein
MSKIEGRNLGEQVIGFIEESLQLKPGSIGLETKIEDLGQDSIQLFSLMTNFEEAFQVHLEYGDLLEIVTVRDAVEKVQKRVGHG